MIIDDDFEVSVTKRVRMTAAEIDAALDLVYARIQVLIDRLADAGFVDPIPAAEETVCAKLETARRRIARGDHYGMSSVELSLLEAKMLHDLTGRYAGLIGGLSFGRLVVLIAEASRRASVAADRRPPGAERLWMVPKPAIPLAGLR